VAHLTARDITVYPVHDHEAQGGHDDQVVPAGPPGPEGPVRHIHTRQTPPARGDPPHVAVAARSGVRVRPRTLSNPLRRDHPPAPPGTSPEVEKPEPGQVPGRHP